MKNEDKKSLKSNINKTSNKKRSIKNSSPRNKQKKLSDNRVSNNSSKKSKDKRKDDDNKHNLNDDSQYWSNLFHDKSLWAMLALLLVFVIAAGIAGRIITGIL